MTERRARLAAVRGLTVALPLLLATPPLAADDDSSTASGLGFAPAASAAPQPVPVDPAVLSPSAPDLAAATDSSDPGGLPATADLPLTADLPATDAAAALAPGIPAEPAAVAVTRVEPLLDPELLLLLAQQDVAALGPVSIGTPDAGLLVNPRPMPEGPMWRIRNPFETWGTQETIDFVAAAIESVNERFPGSPRIVVGDISRPDGGRLNRHKSHQAGRDVDVGFYYEAGEAGDFRQVRKGQLDLPRTWALVRAFVTDTDVDRVFVDRSLIAVLYRYAREEEGEDLLWLDDVFGRGERKGIIQHERRHKDHLHVRFFNRVAQEKGRIVYPVLVEAGVVGPPVVKHVVRRGETIGHLASRYGSSVSAIKAANGLRGTRLRAGRSYLVPVRRVRAEGVPVMVPPRRLPPPPSTQASAHQEPSSATPAFAAGGRN